MGSVKESIFCCQRAVTISAFCESVPDALLRKPIQARHYFCESLFWASQPKQAAKIVARL